MSLKRFICILVFVTVMFSVFGFQNTAGQSPVSSTPQGDRKIVDFKADVMRPIKVGDSSVLNLLGNVVLYHQGTIITCDSAVRYNDMRMECFRNVVINKDAMYAYGDRALYDGDKNRARIFAPIIKMVDDDATLYTFNFSFDTKNNIAEYYGGGTFSRIDVLMESERGYYYVDERHMIGVGKVEMQDSTYKLRSDSVGYNLTTEIAYMYAKTDIWSRDSSIMSAKQGLYDSRNTRYYFTEDAYILTPTRELWSDILDYNSTSKDVVLTKNIQIRDEEQNVMAFGDKGYYWGERDDALLTDNPSLVSFDPEQDTLYMRADSMFMFTVRRDANIRAVSPIKVENEVRRTWDNEEELIVTAPPANAPEAGGPDEGQIGPEDGQLPPTEMLDDGSQSDRLSRRDARRLVAELADGELNADSLTVSVPEIVQAADSASHALFEEQNTTGENEYLREMEELGELAGRAVADSTSTNRPLTIAVDGTTLPDSVVELLQSHRDSLMSSPVPPLDSLGGTMDETLFDEEGRPVTRVMVDSVAGKPSEQDSLVRILKAYNNVKVYRTDLQAVCDSMVAFTIDSTLHMYIDPVIWNEGYQIASEVVDIFTRDGQLDRAVFTGSPIMSGQIDTLHYNQIKGKIIEAFFEDNKVVRTEVKSNGQTYYYMQDDDTGDLEAFISVESADITFYFEDQQIVKIAWYVKPVSTIYPIEMIDEVDTFLPGFEWFGHRRPALEDVFTRVIKDSQREEYEALPQPQFPMTESIFKQKEDYILRNIWRERGEKVSQETLDFVRSLGR